MSNLRICKAMSLHPSANLAINVDANVAAAVHIKADADANSSSSTRICLMGCMATAAELRRFPVHDANRWVRKFITSFISFSFSADLHIDILTHTHSLRTGSSWACCAVQILFHIDMYNRYTYRYINMHTYIHMYVCLCYQLCIYILYTHTHTHTPKHM